MYFKFCIFERLVHRAYQEKNQKGISFKDEYDDVFDYINVFKYYFQKYEDIFKSVHPNVSLKQIKHIMTVMPVINDSLSDKRFYLEPDEYYLLIDRYFSTQCKCDYNINHFFSGDIRLNRYYETLF